MFEPFRLLQYVQNREEGGRNSHCLTVIWESSL